MKLEKNHLWNSKKVFGSLKNNFWNNLKTLLVEIKEITIEKERSVCGTWDIFWNSEHTVCGTRRLFGGTWKLFLLNFVLFNCFENNYLWISKERFVELVKIISRSWINCLWITNKLFVELKELFTELEKVFREIKRILFVQLEEIIFGAL